MASSLFGFQFTDRGNPLANLKSLRAWAATAPRNDPVGAVEAMARVLETGAPHADGSVGRLQALMELDRIAVPLQDHLRLQYRMTSMSDEVRDRLFRACDALARGFSQAYGHYSKQIGESGEPSRMRDDWHGVFARTFHYIGVLTRLGLFRYEQWIPGRWRTLHQTYLAARDRRIANEPYTLSEERPGHLASAEQEYLQVLLLHRLNTGNLTAQQIDWAAEWLREWVSPLRLVSVAGEQGSGNEGYWLDTGQGEGLRDRRPARIESELLFLDIEPLRAQLRALIGRLATQTTGAVRPATDSDDLLTLARRLDRLWLPLAPALARRGERRAERCAVTAAAGWSEIVVALTGRHVRSGGAPDGFHYDDYGRLRNDKDRRPRAGTQRMDRDAWQIFDSSDSGYRLRSSSRPAARQWPGALLALQLEDQPGWQLGIVRRLKRVGADLTELGVEVISRNVSLIMPREGETADSGYSVDGVDVNLKAKSFQALYLPPQIQSRVRTPASLVMQPAEYTIGRRLALSVEGRTHDIVLATPLERTREWVWSPLRSPGGGNAVTDGMYERDAGPGGFGLGEISLGGDTLGRNALGGNALGENTIGRIGGSTVSGNTVGGKDRGSSTDGSERNN